MAEALATRDIYRVTNALTHSRLFVALVARLISRVEAGEGESEMSLAWIESGGERILPVFTGVAELLQWNPSARPLRAESAAVLAASLADGGLGVLINPGTQGFTIDGAAARSLALGYELYPQWQDPAIEAALERSLAGESKVSTAFLTRPAAGEEVDVIVTLLMEPDREVAIRIMERLSQDPEVAVRLERGIDLAVVAIAEG